ASLSTVGPIALALLVGAVARAQESPVFYSVTFDATWSEARLDIFEYIEVFYNRVRRHSALGFKSPANFETLSLMP
ncbi:MAG: IS3 family transposase, partial [Anaerolineae bacterium]|nr:IS3 family transposase [Anaerolineae bacterium]